MAKNSAGFSSENPEVCEFHSDQNCGSNDLAAPDKEARSISLQTVHSGWKDWNTQEAVYVADT